MKGMATMAMLCFALAMGSATVLPAAADNAAYNGNAQHVYLFEKDLSSWEVIENGAWGKMTYINDQFTFNGHALEADTDYTLVRYTDPWNAHVAVNLGEGTTDESGYVQIKGELLDGGAKVWLVPSTDYNEGKLSWANPTEYLFEYTLI